MARTSTRSAATLLAAACVVCLAPPAGTAQEAAHAVAVAAPGPQQPTWSERAPLPERRTEVSAASDGGTIFLIGGFGPPTVEGERASAPRAMWAYDGARNAWRRLGDIPEGVNHAGFVHHEGRLYIVGGFREATFEPVASVRIYDIASGSWSQGAPLPTPRGALAVAVVEGRIHALGGNVAGPDHVHEHDATRVGEDRSVGTHEVYDTRTDRWERRAAMPTPRNHHGAAAVDGRIHVLAGRLEGDMELTVHEIFDTRTGIWSEGAPVPTGRSGIAVVERDRRIYVFGGETFGANARTFDAAERFDPRGGRWERLAPMPTARHGLGAALLDGNIHVISGGPRPGFHYGDHHEVLGGAARALPAGNR
jgi:N-acetylneuraminic acid mutarotase